jgi:DNA-binding response OmpR family regulator
MAEKIRVLMVDDEERFRETTARLLSNRGFETTIAGSGEEALEILETRPQDVVVLDIKMPGLDGHQVLSKIKSQSPETQVIMLTGHGSANSARAALSQRAYDYLSKPCDIDILTAKITAAHMDRTSGGKRREKTVRDIMIHVDDYSKVSIDDTVQHAVLTLMASFNKFISSGRIMETGHRSVLVYDQHETVVGIVGITDLIRALRPDYLSAAKPSTADSMQYSAMFWEGLFTAQAQKLAKKTVGEIMSDTPLCVDHGMNLMEVADTMFTSQIRRLIVTDDQKIIGVVREQEIFFEIANIIV